MQKANIRGRQFFILVTLYMLGSAILVMPSTLSIQSKQDAWISALFVMLIGIGNAWLVYLIYRRFPDKNLVAINQAVFGQKIGTAVSLLFFSLFTFVITSIPRGKLKNVYPLHRKV